MLPVALVALAACQQPPRSDLTLSFESRLRLAEAAAGEGRGANAARLSMLREASEQRPDDAALLARYAQAAEQSGQLAEAAAVQRRLMERDGPSATRLITIGRLQLRAGDAEGAAQAYGEALALAPRSDSAAGGLGLANDLAGNHAAAQQAYRQGLASNPTDWVLRSNLAMSLLTVGQAGEAAVVLGDAEILASAPSHARHNLALAFAAGGQTERAVRVLRTEMGPSEAQAMTDDMAAFARWLGNAAPAPELAAVAASTNGGPGQRRR